ncbi:putative ABC transporter ATP-binding protein [uncultured archaeon]|nr:putative ABC transporter ATP-binding protein [uncultured archaeon]
MQEPVISLENVTKEYRMERAVFQALKGVSLKIHRGEFVSIVGPSGSGKSTLLHLLGCLDVPSGGEVYLSGKPVSKMKSDELADARNSKIGFVFQAFNLSPTLQVEKNVELPLIIRGMGEAERRGIAMDRLSAVGLSSKAENMPSQLSGGEKQRVAIARALATNPDIILADEPTGNLDSVSGKEVMDFIASLWRKKGITVIIVTHEPMVAAYAERKIHIRDGRVEKDEKQKPFAGKITDIKIK